MEASELRNFTVEELQSRIRQWRDELFRSKFKSESSEAKNTSVFRKLKKDIARAATVLTEKSKGVEVKSAPAPAKEPKKAKAAAPKAEAAAPSDKVEKAPKAKKTTKSSKSKVSSNE